MQPELLMAGETVLGRSNGWTAQVADRLRAAMGHGYEPQILHLHPAGGLNAGHNRMQASAWLAARHQFPK
jgi:hypothetical protein